MHATASPFVLFATLVASSLACPVAAQAAQVVQYGLGCSWNGTPLAIGVQGTPQLGSTVTIDYSGPNFAGVMQVQPVLVLGLAADSALIPVSFLPQQPAQCFAWVQPLLFAPMPVATAGGYLDSQDIVVPNDPTLIGMQFFAQWMATVVQCGFVPPCTLEALPTSDALQLIVGL
jgi:hypothetical protein